MKANYISSVGFMYDLLFMYKLYFNKGEWRTEFVIHSKSEKDKAHYDSIMKWFDGAPEEGQLFFHINDAGQTFMDTLLFEMLNGSGEITFAAFLDAFRNTAAVRQKLIMHYLDQVSDEEPRVDQIVDRIDASDYPEEIKHLLISFLLRSENYVRTIADDLTVKEGLLSAYYDKNQKLLSDVCASVGDDVIQELTGGAAELNYAVSLIGRNEIVTVESEENSLVILGSEYQAVLEEQKEDDVELDITGFGKVMSESNRAMILDMLLEDKELSTSEIAKRLRVSVNAAYYHLNMMTDIDMLYSRTEGRTVYFKINPNHFVAVKKALEKYLGS